MPNFNCHPYVKRLTPAKSEAINASIKTREQHHHHHHKSTVGETTGSVWQVPELCKAYNWPTNLPGGGIIGIVELGGGWVKSDIDEYFKSIGQPSPTIVDVSVDGTVNSPGDDADIEVALDIEVAGAAYFAATGKPATIHMYWSQDIGKAVKKSAIDKCSVCSISWGADEAEWGKQSCQEMEATAIAATAVGTTVFAAAGDNDSSDGGRTPANVGCPASCPHIIGCGGTSKTDTSEVVWNDNPGQTDGSGTGGGYSTVFPVQSWQLNIPAAPKELGRMVPDVAANADPDTGYVIIQGGQEQIVGGTSAVAPLYAGLFAAIGDNSGFISPALWANPHVFELITSGSNGVYDAGDKPSPCTGLGVPNAKKITSFVTTL